MSKKYTIDDLLRSLQNPSTSKLENTRETWSRIGNKDKFDELGLEPSELEDFLKEFVAENGYNNI